jgi:uncharacterized protein (DUF4415 family)
MPAKKRVSRRSLGSDLKRVDAHKIKPHEYVEAPRLSDEMLSRMVLKKRGRPITGNARRLLTLRLPVEVIERWKATGPGWQTRMAERLSKTR